MCILTDSPKIIVALDFDTLDLCLDLVRRLDPSHCRLKIGKEMFTWFGPSLVEQLQKMGFDVFLDLKFHDIPNTVAKALKAAASLGVWMVNIHTSGGPRMLEASVNAFASINTAPLLIGVTVLTSMESADLHALGIDDHAEMYAKKLAKLAYQSGLDGVVCSAREVSSIKKACHENFLCVTPGIRPASAATDDQRRIMTPAQALSQGSDYLVIGRPITQADNPSNALRQIVMEVEAEV